MVATVDRSEARAAALRMIVSQLRGGHAAGALESCVAAIADDPASATLQALAAAAALQAGEPDAAVGHARQALELRADHAPTLVLFGRALRAADRLREAAAAFDRAMGCDRSAAMPAFLLCATLLQDGDPRAATMLEKLLTQFPDEAEGWREIGLVLHDLGKPDAALACFGRAMRTAPDAGLALRMGTVLKDRGRFGEAARAFGQAVELDPGSVRAHFLLGLCLQDWGDRPAAAAAYRRALALDPTLAEAALNLGTVLQDEGDLDGAKAAYRQALAARPAAFGRIAQAMTTSPRGELWLDLGRLRRVLAR